MKKPGTGRISSIWAALTAVIAVTAIMDTTATEIDLSPQAELTKPRIKYYNLRIRDLRLTFTGNAVMRWTDNVGYSEAGDSDWSLVPSLGVRAYCPISPYFQISGGITAGYQFYLNGNGKDQFFVRGSEGQLDADVTAEILLDEDTSIKLRDSLSREIDSLDIAARGRTEDYAAWNHSFSATYSKAINRKTRGSLQYTHEDRWTGDKDFEYLNYSSDALDTVLLYRLMKHLSLGPYFRVNNIRFHEDLRNDRTNYEGGLTTTGNFRVGGNISYTFNFGYQTPSINDNNDPAATDDESGVVTNFNLSVAPTVFPGHRFRASYERNHEDLDPGVNYANEFSLGYGLDIRIIKEMLVSADVDWLDISASDNGENAQLWRFILRTSYDLTDKTSLNAKYRYTDKSSDISGNDFAQNFFELGVSHRF